MKPTHPPISQHAAVRNAVTDSVDTAQSNTVSGNEDSNNDEKDEEEEDGSEGSAGSSDEGSVYGSDDSGHGDAAGDMDTGGLHIQ